MDNFTQDLLKAIASGGKAGLDEIARSAMRSAVERGVNEVVKAEPSGIGPLSKKRQGCPSKRRRPRRLSQ